MILKLMYTNCLILFIFCSICCNKKQTNFLKNDIIITKVESINKNIISDTLPLSVLEKYKSQKYFNLITKSSKRLQEDINRIYKNKTNIEYKEIQLDKYVTLCQFIFSEEVQYDFYYKSKKLIFKAVTPLNKAHYNFEYKDWNYDNIPEVITIYEQWEGGGGFGYSKIQSIYKVQEDTLMKIVSIPIKNVICQNGKISLIEELSYKFNSKTNKLTIKKTTGTGDCNKNIITNIKSIKSQNILLKKYDNNPIIID